MTGIPTRPASSWNGGRAEGVRRASVCIGGLAGATVLLDVNRSGALVEAARVLRTGANVTLRFILDGTEYRFAARVVEASSRYRPNEAARHRMGLIFRTMTPSEWQALDRMVGQLSSEPAARTCQPGGEVAVAA